jgi:Zn-dependent M28 family amino/carboxypeptidase
VRDILLIGHVDSHRTPIIFSTSRWVSAYQAFTTAAFVLFAGQAALYVLGTFTGWEWVWPVTLASVVGAILLIAICVQADSTPFSPGANDNATGAGLVLALAQDALQHPLEHSRLWLVCTGCEETQHYGAIDFFRKHRSELRDPVAVVFEMMGCAGPAWLTREGIVIPFQADPRLMRIAARLAQEHPEWGAYATRIRGGNTEMADAHRAGVPAITLNGLAPSGQAPFWHQAEDTFDKIDPAVLTRAYSFTWELLQSLDRHGLAGARSDLR